MALINDVKIICDRLAPLGWRDLLLDVTSNALDISQSTGPKLKAALTAPLSAINRTKPGFEDFHPAATQAITPSQPGQSLFYHALASPHVHPATTGAPTAKNYPTLEELDVIENFIYSLAANRTDLADTVVAVFAYQYREANRTPHERYSDLAFSRTGVARVGTAPHNYDPSRRSFWILPARRATGVAVLPARYAVFLARKAKPGPAGSVLGGHREAADKDFVFPVHKLFSGTECLQGKNLKVSFLEFHRNEKLRMTHRLTSAEGGLRVPPGFDIDKAPYVRDSSNGANLVGLVAAGSSVLVVPTPGKSLVQTASQKNSNSNTNQLVHFIVPEKQTVRDRETRFAESSLEIPAFNNDRLSPEYVNIRHKIVPTGPVTQKPTDLNQLPPAAFAKAMEKGDYAAAHFTDDCCDGCVEAVVTGLPSPAPNFPAFSLVTAVDFFPLADQIEMDSDPTIRQTDPLSKGRLPVNPFLPRPSNSTRFSFARADKTVTAVVGVAASGPPNAALRRANRTVSFLPDAASNVFAPGWDTSRSRDATGTFLTSYGLGSPFPEDAKLCAALSSFWPAVAPDNARTFGNRDFENQLPMLDEELGFHPNHERVASGEVTSFRGWDGEYGPFFEKVGGKLHVNFVAIERSDYVSNALANRITVSLTAEIQSDDLIARHQALDACMGIETVTSNSMCLVVARKIADWATFGRGSSELQGGGFLLEFAELTGGPKATSEIPRVRCEVSKRHLCQVGSNGIAYKNGNAAFRFLLRA